AIITDLYRRRGFVSASPKAAEEPERNAGGGAVPLVVRITIDEGPRTMVSAVNLTGDTAGMESAWKSTLGLQPGRPYVERQLVADRDALQSKYADLGYPAATVDADPGFNSDRTMAAPTFMVRLGPRITVDHILIVGNVKTSADTIQRELQI